MARPSVIGERDGSAVGHRRKRWRMPSVIAVASFARLDSAITLVARDGSYRRSSAQAMADAVGHR
jgi:hypothetical protein